MSNLGEVIIVFLIVFYNLTLIIGTAYLVFYLGYSSWWFLLTVVLLAGSNPKKDV